MSVCIFTSPLPDSFTRPLSFFPSVCYKCTICPCACVCRFNEDLELEDAIHTAILALKVRQAGKEGYVAVWAEEVASCLCLLLRVGLGNVETTSLFWGQLCGVWVWHVCYCLCTVCMYAQYQWCYNETCIFLYFTCSQLCACSWLPTLAHIVVGDCLDAGA